MKFEIGQIVSHISNINRFYIITGYLNKTQYLLDDLEDNEFGVKQQWIFMEDYLLSKTDRRDYAINEIIEKI